MLERDKRLRNLDFDIKDSQGSLDEKGLSMIMENRLLRRIACFLITHHGTIIVVPLRLKDKFLYSNLQRWV